MADVKVYWLRVFDRTSRAVVAVYGTEAAGVTRQDDQVYGKYPGADYVIERGVFDSADYKDFPDCPAQDDPQRWAEFVKTPG